MLIRRDSFHRVGPFSEALRSVSPSTGRTGTRESSARRDAPRRRSRAALASLEQWPPWARISKSVSPGAQGLTRPPGPVEGSEYRSERGTRGLVAFLDADDVIPPTELAVQATYLLAHPKSSCVLGRTEWIFQDGQAPAWMTRDPSTGIWVGFNPVRRWSGSRPS